MLLLLLLLLLFSTLNFLKSDKIKKPLLRRTFFGFRSRLFRGSSGFLLLSFGFRDRLRLGFRLESLLLGLRFDMSTKPREPSKCPISIAYAFGSTASKRVHRQVSCTCTFNLTYQL